MTKRSGITSSRKNDARQPQGRAPQRVRTEGHFDGQTGLLALQDAIGNRAVGAMVQAAASPRLDAAQDLPPAVRSVIRSNGQPLDSATRAEMEESFGEDFTQVRVHSDAEASEATLALGARAYTAGEHIVFDEGRYAPGTVEGRRLLAHELAHVVQQTHRPRGQRSSPGGEAEADRAAAQALGGRPAPVQMAASGVQCERLSIEELSRRLEENKKRRAILVLSPAEHKRLDKERQELERQLYGMSTEEVNREAARAFGLMPGGKRNVERFQQRLQDAARTHAPPTEKELQEERKEAAKMPAKRRQVEQANQLTMAKPPTDLKQRIERAAINQGVPAKTFQRPLTDFEVRLRADTTIQLAHPKTGIKLEKMKTSLFKPLADPETGEIIAYAGPGGDLMIYDVNGTLIQEGDIPSTPSAIQPDDVVLVGGSLVKVGAKLIARGGASLIESGGRLLSRQVLRRLRTAAAGTMIGTTEAAPMIGGRLAARATITAEAGVGAEVAEAAGKSFAEGPPLLKAGDPSKLIGGSGKAAAQTGKAMGQTGKATTQTGKSAAADVVAEAKPQLPGAATPTTPSPAATPAPTTASAPVPSTPAKPYAGPQAIWDEGTQVRGLNWETAMGKLYKRMGPVRRMPKNFKGVDYTSGGTSTPVTDATGKRIGEIIDGAMGISEKTLDLRGTSVQTAKGMASALKRHVNSLFKFESYTLEGIEVRNLKTKIVNILIGPGKPSAQQMAGINEAIEHAKLNDILLNIIQF